LILLLTAVSPLRAPAQAPDSSSFVRVISAETLRKAGVVRLAEMLRLVDDWDVTTQDEFVWSGGPSGGAPGVARRIVLVDGRRMELDLFGVSSLARLPVPIETIDRVEVVRTPVLAGGELAGDGVIHLYTRDPPPGVSAAGWATTGSEIGDPGPFAFTPLASSNVDRIGNDGSGRLGYRGKRWFADVAVQIGKHNSTDPAIVDRLAAAANEEGRVRSTVFAPAARFGIRLPTNRHTLWFGHSRTREYLPIEPVAGELAVLERYSQLGLDGTFGAAGGRSLRYSASWAQNRAEERRPALPSRFDWRATTLTAGVELAAPGRRAHLRVGGRIRQVRAAAPQAIERDRLSHGTLYGEVAAPNARIGAPVLTGELSTSGGELGFAAALRSRWRAGRRAAVDVIVAYGHPTHSTDNSIWAWTERGYPLIDASGSVAVLRGPLLRPSRIGLDVAIESSPTTWSSIRLEGFWRRHHGLALVERALTLDQADQSFRGPADLSTAEAGQIAGALLSASARARGVSFRASYRFEGVTSGSDRFRAELARVPRHSLRYSLEVTPASGLDFWSMLEYRSATHWRDFESIEAQTGGAYRARVPGAVAIDIALQKWLWQRRLRAHLGFRNLLGSDVRYHPAGATVGPRMYVQVEGAVP
jgi:hypothetical protein